MSLARPRAHIVLCALQGRLQGWPHTWKNLVCLPMSLAHIVIKRLVLLPMSLALPGAHIVLCGLQGCFITMQSPGLSCKAWLIPSISYINRAKSVCPYIHLYVPHRDLKCSNDLSGNWLRDTARQWKRFLAGFQLCTLTLRGHRAPKQGSMLLCSLNHVTCRELHKTKAVGRPCFSGVRSCFWTRNLDLEGPGSFVLL
jgi:hypothetical protein